MHAVFEMFEMVRLRMARVINVITEQGKRNDAMAVRLKRRVDGTLEIAVQKVKSLQKRDLRSKKIVQAAVFFMGLVLLAPNMISMNKKTYVYKGTEIDGLTRTEAIDLFAKRFIKGVHPGEETWRLTSGLDVASDGVLPSLSDEATWAIIDLAMSGKGTLDDVIKKMLKNGDFDNPKAGIYYLVKALDEYVWFDVDKGPEEAKKKFKTLFSTLIANNILIYQGGLTSVLIRTCGSLGILPGVKHPITEAFVAALKDVLKDRTAKLREETEKMRKERKASEQEIIKAILGN